jgi:DUF4097 and DUF4098 domain-containing protein YvlB
MSARHESFQVGERPRIQVRFAAGSARILQGPAGTITIDLEGRGVDSLVVEQIGDSVTVRQEDRVVRGSVQVTITAPEGVSVTAALASADLDVELPVEDLSASLASGDVRASEVRRELAVKTASGDVEIDKLSGKGKLNAASGDVRVENAYEDVSVNTASGDIDVNEARGDLRLRSASGDVNVKRYLGADVSVSTISGDATLRIPTGRSVDVELRSLSGSIKLPSRSAAGDTPGGHRPKVRVRFKSVSGDFELATSDS